MPRNGYERFDGSGPQIHETPPTNFEATDTLPTTAVLQPGHGNGVLGRQDSTPHRTQHNVESDERSRWDNVKDLDHFFTSLYTYQQRGGFGAILVDDILQLLQFVFIVAFATFLLCCVDYGVLFNDAEAIAKLGLMPGEKIVIANIIKPDALSHLPFLVVIGLLLAFAFLVIRIIRLFYQASQHYDMRRCYDVVLGIKPEELDNLTWHQVMRKLIQAQEHVKLCIHKSELTELDVYQRILRFKNYTVAMVNQDLLPVRYEIPGVGEAVYLTESLKANLHWLFFTGPFSPWKDFFTVRVDYKDAAQMDRLTEEMQKVILITGCVNLACMPLVFIWQILYIFCVYAQLMKRQPGALGMKRWSNYARLSLRHFNELPHELRGRLCRAHRAATQYMDQFTTHLTEVIAKDIAGKAGMIFVVISVLSAWDEDVLQVEHVITILAACGGILFICNVFITQENMVWHPHLLMDMVTAHVHYVPTEWKDEAHSETVRYAFSQLFEFRIFHICEEMFSPLITPFVLIFWLRPRARMFVQFFHDYTVTVEGVGDVCSFAQMETGGRHGDKEWQMREDNQDKSPFTPQRTYATAANGKLELSCVHFALNNPEWQPPPATKLFINTLKNRALSDAHAMAETRGTLAQNVMASSLTGMSMENSIMNNHGNVILRGRGVNNIAGPIQSEENSTMQSSSLLQSLHDAGMMPNMQSSNMNMDRSVFGNNTSTAIDASTAAAEMSVHALYLREIRRRSGAQYMSTMQSTQHLDAGRPSTMESITSMIRPPAVQSRMREMQERSPIKTAIKAPNYSSVTPLLPDQSSSTPPPTDQSASSARSLQSTRAVRRIEEELNDDEDTLDPLRVWGGRLEQAGSPIELVLGKRLSQMSRHSSVSESEEVHEDEEQNNDMPPNSFSAI